MMVSTLVAGGYATEHDANAAITLRQPGEYRVDADGDRNSTIATVRRGDAEVSVSGATAGSTFPLHHGQSATISGMDTVAQEVAAAAPPDEFDRWCEARDRREQQSQSTEYVSPEMTGYEDLDANGVWREEPQYGWVWAPRVEVGWAPYHYGHWVWVEPWGWTWIDDASWGFAPFHYGRWALLGGGWVWVPGTRVVRPVYAPALVVFVGGPGLGGGGFAAWFPLGPREVYRPAYRVSEVYVRQVNVTHVTNINVVNERYINQRVPGAVTAVPRETFVSARPVARSAVRLDARELAQAQVVGTTAPIAPRRESVLAGSPRAGAPPARYAERTVVVRTAPPQPPVSFRAKQQALEANQGRPLDAGQLSGLRNSAPPPRPLVRTIPPATPQLQRIERPPAFQNPPSRRTEDVRPPQAPQPPRPVEVVRPQPPSRRTEEARPSQAPQPPRPVDVVRPQAPPRPAEAPRPQAPPRRIEEARPPQTPPPAAGPAEAPPSRPAAVERREPKNERKPERKVEKKEEKKQN